jgi:hypothetical protein
MNEELAVQPSKPPLDREKLSVPENDSENATVSVGSDGSDATRSKSLTVAITRAEKDLTQIHGIEEKLGIKLPQAVAEKEGAMNSFKAVFDDMTGKMTRSEEEVGNPVLFQFLKDIGEVNAIADADSLYDDFIAQHPKEAEQYKDQYFGIAAAFKRRGDGSPEKASELHAEAPTTPSPDGASDLSGEVVPAESVPMTDAMMPETASTLGESEAASQESADDGVRPQQESLEKKNRLMEDINLNTEKILKHAESLQMSLRFLDRAIDDMNSSRSGFNIGKKLEESSLFTEIKQQARRLADGASSMKRLPLYADGEDALMKQSVDMLSRNISEGRSGIQMLEKRMDAFYRGVSALQKKIADFYDGKSNTDEDALRNFQGQVRSTFENLKDLDRAYRNQELMLADLRQDKSI